MEYYKSVLRIVILATLLPKSQSIPGPRVTTPGHTRPQPTEQYIADKLSGVVPDEGNQRINGTIMIRGNNFTYLDIEQVREQVTPEGELYREIMSNYDKNTRPIINASEVVNINLTFTFHQVLDVEEKEQILSVILTMDHHWWDEKLVWNPTDFNNISQLKLPSTDIWLPDIVLYNTAEDRIKKPSSSSMSRAFVKYDGQIYWPPVRKFQSTCNIDITYFPFDDQICYLKLGSWAYDGFQVDVWNTMELMDMSQASTNSEFQVVNSSVRKFITYYDCCLEPYPDVKVYIHIRRKTIQHVFNIVIPCIVLSIICMVGFLIPPDKIDEKISVQLTVLFSLSLFMLLVAESTPRTSESVPLISIYLTALMCITAMSTTAHVVCDKLVASSKVRNQVPYLANKLIYRLARLCQNNKLLNKKKEDEGEENEEFVYENGNTIELKENGSKEQNGTKPKQGMKLETGKRDLLGPSSNGRLKRGASQMERVRRLNTRQKRGQSVSFTPGNLGKQKKPLNDDTEEGLQGLFHHLKIRQDKMRTEFQETAKWYKVATKMDKIFFWGYGISVTILTFYAFIFKPMQKDVQL